MTDKPRAGVARPVPTTTLLVKDIQALATCNSDLGEIKDAAIYVEGNVIRWVGKTCDVPAAYSSADSVLSLENRVVIPGMVNTHHHMFQCLTRCVATDSPLFGWLKACYEAWAHLEGSDVYTAAKLAMAELILSGCTTSSDHLYMYPNSVTLDDTIRAAREIGLRFNPTRGAMSLGHSAGGLCPDAITEREEDALADMERCIKEFHDTARHSMLRIALAPCSPFTVTNAFMEAAARLARSYSGVRLHTHLAENQEDIDFHRDVVKLTPAEYIKQVGWDKDDCWFAHCVMAGPAELDVFAERGIGFAHCPSSNQRLASGIAPVRAALDKGVNVGLGVDGSASNDSSNMLAEMRGAALLQRAHGDVKGLTDREALQLATVGGARNLGRDDDIGQIAPGYAADFVAWRTDGIAFAGAQIDVVGALVWCSSSLGPVDLSVINGDIIVREGRLLTLDLPALIAEHNAASARLCAHLPTQYLQHA